MSSKQGDMEEASLNIGVSFTDWAKMVAYCRSAKPNEIMGLAHVREVGGTLLIYDPFILKQKVTGTTCEFDRKDLANWLGTYDHIGKVKCIWHSHVEMSAFFSSCDRGTSQALAGLGKMMGGSSSWFLSLVLNCKEEYQAKVDMYKPFEIVVPCKLNRFQSTDDAVDVEVKEKVLEEKYEAPKGGSAGRSKTWFPELGWLDMDAMEQAHLLEEGPSSPPVTRDEEAFDNIFEIIQKAKPVKEGASENQSAD